MSILSNAWTLGAASAWVEPPKDHAARRRKRGEPAYEVVVVMLVLGILGVAGILALAGVV